MYQEYYDEPPPRPAYRCGGYASSSGHCGATDCDTCYPGSWSDEEEESQPETVRDLSSSGYTFLEGVWSRGISRKTHTARRDHNDGRIKKGQSYTKTTTRHIDDETGQTWLDHYKVRRDWGMA